MLCAAMAALAAMAAFLAMAAMMPMGAIAALAGVWAAVWAAVPTLETVAKPSLMGALIARALQQLQQARRQFRPRAAVEPGMAWA